MNGIGLIALDLGLRGAAAGLFLMTVVVLLRVRPSDQLKLLGAAMATGGAAYAIATAPFVPKATQIWTVPFLATNPVIFWLWARAAIDDEFELRRWHGLLWLAVVALGFSVFLTWTIWPIFAKAAARSLSVIALVMSFAAAVQTVRTWSTDLVGGRRQLRAAVLILSLMLIVPITATDLMSVSVASYGIPGSLLSAASLAALAALAGASLFYPRPASPMVAAAAASRHAGRLARIEPRTDNGNSQVAPHLLRRLDHLMIVERVYRQDGVTIASLAAQLDLPDYRLRQIINEGMGYRNFNAFLNRYRLDDAKGALSDPSQREVPVLTIALDAGFQSIGPFNRAFKADTGITPTEFRRDALARLQAIRSEGDDLKIGQSG
ncbi:helix-turn-helix domain-containing protein [Tardiphaga sp.]|uniref:AraC family transcriptional regulator n=1 Tax=Tardiphaga sp. TaxID=1926292 RepID=UPI0025FD5B2A|nr:helix-turn-helix domain-containing protein [Tardiphaga sp.]